MTSSDGRIWVIGIVDGRQSGELRTPCEETTRVRYSGTEEGKAQVGG